MFIESFKVISLAIFELVFLGSVGFFLVKRAVIGHDGLRLLSDLVIGLFLPFFMFTEIVSKFSFNLYPDWWMFPLYSFFITVVGFACGHLFLFFDKSLCSDKEEFLGVTSFQNSGYLPLPLVAVLLPQGLADQMYIYIFLFLIGFNMVIFSFGAMLLCPKGACLKFDIKHMLSAPVVATVAALLCVFFRVHALFPQVLLRPMATLGKCAIPLSILVVGGNLALFKSKSVTYFKSISFALIAKLIVMPLIFLGLIIWLKPRPLVGFLLLLQAAMPPAALLSVISKKHGHRDHLISQSIFLGHLASIVTIPLFLALFWAISGTF
ncbi:MAG: AEC family transporter [Candidatus Omnitrophota bacterium]